MLLCFVFAKLHPRRSPRFSNLLTYQRLNVPTRLSRKSLPHNLFADPHPLNPYATIFYKNSGGAGPAMLSTFNVPTCKCFNASSGGSPIFRTLSKFRIPQVLYLPLLRKHRGVAASSHSGTHLSPSCSNDLQTIPFPFTLLRTLLHNEHPLSPSFSCVCALFPSRRRVSPVFLFNFQSNICCSCREDPDPVGAVNLFRALFHGHGSRCGFFARGVRLAD